MSIEVIRVQVNYSSIGEATDEETTAFWHRYAEELQETLEAEYPEADVEVTYEDAIGVTPPILVVGSSLEDERAAMDNIEAISERLYVELLKTV